MAKLMHIEGRPEKANAFGVRGHPIMPSSALCLVVYPPWPWFNAHEFV